MKQVAVAVDLLRLRPNLVMQKLFGNLEDRLIMAHCVILPLRGSRKDAKVAKTQRPSPGILNPAILNPGYTAEMDARGFTGIVRVTHSREDVELATRIGIEKKREGYSPEALVLAIDEVLNDIKLSRAIVVYVQANRMDEGTEKLKVGAPIFSILPILGIAAMCIWGVIALFHQVTPSSEFLNVIFIVVGQAILLRVALHAVRLAVMAQCDAMNNAAYPTNLHPFEPISSPIGSIRLRRLRALITETADRIVKGENPKEIASELSVINLTPRASKMVVALGRISAVIRDFLPPYEPRWLAFTLAVAFIVTCIIFVERAGDRISEGYKNYAIGVSGWIAGDLAAAPRRRPRSRAS